MFYRYPCQLHPTQVIGSPRTKHTELSRSLPVSRRRRPPVRPGNVVVASQSDHRLDGERHARLHYPDRLVPSIMQNVWWAMEEPVDAVAAVRPDRAASTLLGPLLNQVAELFERHPGLHSLYGHVETLPRRLDDANRVRVLLGTLSDIVGFIQVRMVSSEEERDVKVEYIAVHEESLVGDAVADDLVR